MAAHGLSSRMALDIDAASSSSLSVPASPQAEDTIRVARSSMSSQHPHAHAHPASVVAGASATTATASTSAPPSAAASRNAPLNGTNDATTEKQKRPRKKRDTGPDTKMVIDDPPKKTRKPRTPRESTNAKEVKEKPAVTRKRKAESKPEPSEKQTTLDVALMERSNSTSRTDAEMPVQQHTAQQPQQPAQQPPPPPAAPAVAQARAENGFLRNILSPHTRAATAPSARPSSSGQNYDPIRGSTVDAPRQPPPPIPQSSLHTSPHANRASASPSIASLIDPFPATGAATQTTNVLQSSPGRSALQTTQTQLSPPQTQPTINLPGTPPRPSITSVPKIEGDAMDIDAPTCEIIKPTAEPKAPSKPSSAAPAPKTNRPSADALVGTGSGLLSSADLFGGPSMSEAPERRGVNIELHIPLDPRGGNTINIAQEIVKKYGRDAINPRAAAHRELLLRIAARQNALDRVGSNANGNGEDHMSVDDLNSDIDGDSVNMDLGGAVTTPLGAGGDDDRSATGAENAASKPTRKRKKAEDYDKDDDFIDDTELAWQQQAAVAKDGFFVYSGPLVPEGSTAVVENASGGVVSGRGSRGRGRGRGRAAAASSSTTHASLAAEKRANGDAGSSTANSTAGTGRGRGRGRGTGATRKPRITKADRERMELEKAAAAAAAAANKTSASGGSLSAGTGGGIGGGGGGGGGLPGLTNGSAGLNGHQTHAQTVMGSLA